ncbi:glycosyltransferase family 2 protein [Aestuariibaculum marinum]|uniref:Glycosyltransferase n=1 Tax=Aestuariibaculum marinum TaxID=2683592 RepID=A0A8J6U4P5_9FLAO|nr:glycosyltransferase [Aestuariibaculum marinum]MBD0824320.1 glycosyltransferase [Aestuariibaculum marinum]
MLSILIPTYNYNVYPLAKELENQANNCNITYEIICFDDGSSSDKNIENEKINLLKYSSFKVLPQNIGRSKIRNLLASNAQYDWMLFLDADTEINNLDFLNRYLKNITKDDQIIYGGIVYQKNRPKPDKVLRWVYGNHREALTLSQREKKPYISFLTLNFLIHKSVLKKIKFNEDIPNLRHEDTLFSITAKANQIKIKHINNPVVHLGLDTNQIFLKKSLESVYALKILIRDNYLTFNDTQLSKTANTLKTYKLDTLFILSFSLFKPMLKKNILSSSPSLFIFDLYRLGYYLNLT